MSLKFITNKSYLENVNGLQNFEEFNINYDSNRDKNKQVKASFNNNGKKYYVEDSLQKFMNTMPINQNSIFDLLKNDLHESKNTTTNLSSPTKYMKLKNGNVNGNRKKNKNKNVTRKSYKGNIRVRVNKGITSKLFDYNKEILPDNNYTLHVSNKHKHGKKHTRKMK
jgi:hypothetical protein